MQKKLLTNDRSDMWWFQFILVDKRLQQNSGDTSERLMNAVHDKYEQTPFPLKLYRPKMNNITLNLISEVLKL